MIRILFYLAIIFALGLGFAWLADRPGEMVVTFSGYQYQVSLMVAAVAVVAVVTQSKTAQMHTLVHVADIQPTDYLVDQMDQRVSALVAKIDGPAKSVVPITGGLYQTTAYWAGGAYSNVFPCVNTPTSPGDTYEKIGAQEVGTYDGRVYPAGSEGWNLSLGCKGGPEYCDAGGDEFCVSSHRAAGCYVNSEWATWYRARVAAQGAQPKVEEFCAPPL